MGLKIDSRTMLSFFWRSTASAHPPHDPYVKASLLLDEHTAALDPHMAQLVMDLTKKFASDDKLTVMMITHNMNHALSYGNRLLMMDEGEIVLDIGAEEKAKLSMAEIISQFKAIKKKEIVNDQMLLQ